MTIERHDRISDVLIVKPKVFSDHRGYFFESHRVVDFYDAAKLRVNFVQGNVSTSVPWTLRGMHYQIKDPQGKLLRCLRGSIFAACVDLRKGSPTLGKAAWRNLDEENHEAMWVPPGFANGFLSGPKGALVQYECSSYYVEEVNRALRWNDDDVRIPWPMQQGQNPNMTNKDRAAKIFKECDLVDMGDQP